MIDNNLKLKEFTVFPNIKGKTFYAKQVLKIDGSKQFLLAEFITFLIVSGGLLPSLYFTEITYKLQFLDVIVFSILYKMIVNIVYVIVSWLYNPTYKIVEFKCIDNKIKCHEYIKKYLLENFGKTIYGVVKDDGTFYILFMYKQNVAGNNFICENDFYFCNEKLKIIDSFVFKQFSDSININNFIEYQNLKNLCFGRKWDEYDSIIIVNNEKFTFDFFYLKK